MTGSGQEARYFRTDSSALFGVFYDASGDVVRDTGVLICYPAPQEYSALLWSTRQLAGSLAAAGFPVLRFDYSGTGDSAGDLPDASVAQWISDIVAAGDELRERAGVRRLHVVGVRLGAALALRAVEEGMRVRDLVLWDPIVNGFQYLATMERFDQRYAQGRHFPVSDHMQAGAVVGFEIGEQLRGDIAKLDMLAAPLGSPQRVFLLAPAADSLFEQLVKHAQSENERVTAEVVSDPVIYGSTMDPTETVLATAAPRAILQFLGSRE